MVLNEAAHTRLLSHDRSVGQRVFSTILQQCALELFVLIT